MNRGRWIALAAGGLVFISLSVWLLLRPADGGGQAARIAEMADQWSGAIQFEAGYDALDPAAGGAGASTQASVTAHGFDPSDEYWGLPRNEGYQEVASFCAACHSLQLVMQQSRSERRWNELIDRMISQQGMPAPSPQDRERIARYLARNFGEN